MKKILIASYYLDFGGIEKSLINLLKKLDPKKYDITLLLQEKRGIFLKDIPSYVHVEEYALSNIRFVPLRKIYNRLHLLWYTLSHFKKYDHSICYATYDIPSSIITKRVGKKSTLWVHSNYAFIYDKENFIRFFDKREVSKFNQIVFVSNESKNDFLKIYPSLETKAKVTNNLFDVVEIRTKAEQSLSLFPTKENMLFVGRLEEDSKGILRLLSVMKTLQEKKSHKHLYIIGDGPDKGLFEKYVEDNHLENVTFLGSKSNPYPYIKQADLFVLPSYYEGFPVVCMEALILGKKVMTTIAVTTGSFALKDYVFLAQQDENSIYETIEKAFINKIPKAFDENTFIQETIQNTEKIIEG
ncbi:MAG: glycosyltransferase [Bacilli bacterium]|nr:glycosyltransferase [Bacilli bacterium]